MNGGSAILKQRQMGDVLRAAPARAANARVSRILPGWLETILAATEMQNLVDLLDMGQK